MGLILNKKYNRVRKRLSSFKCSCRFCFFRSKIAMQFFIQKWAISENTCSIKHIKKGMYIVRCKTALNILKQFLPREQIPQRGISSTLLHQ